jgi:signal transduction histidine kinase
MPRHFVSAHPGLSRRDRGRTPSSSLSAGAAMGFLAHLIAYVFTCLIIFVTAGFFPTIIVALAWGIGLVSHGLFAVVMPVLRAAQAEHEHEHEEEHEIAAVEADLQQHARSVGSSSSGPRPLNDMDAQRARSLEELSAAIAHEIRNPITAAKSLVQQIAEDPAASENAEHARVAVEELDRVERSIAHLLRFAREEPFEPTALEVRELIESAVDLLRDRAERQHVRIERDIERLPSLHADGEQLRKVLSNLISNALDAHAERPRPDAWLKISAGQNLAGDEVWIRVRDNGPGLDATQRSQAFRPFYTSKRGGTGLGLALARKVVARHGGSIELVDSKGPGAEFLISLPRLARSADVGP